MYIVLYCSRTLKFSFSRRDLEYAAKALPCAWVLKFERAINNMKPFSSHEVAENEMKEAIEDLQGNSWLVSFSFFFH